MTVGTALYIFSCRGMPIFLFVGLTYCERCVFIISTGGERPVVNAAGLTSHRVHRLTGTIPNGTTLSLLQELHMSLCLHAVVFVI